MCKEQIALELVNIYCNTYLNAQYFSFDDIYEVYLDAIKKLNGGVWYMLKLIIWIISGILKVAYMVYYHKRINKTWKTIDTIAALAINMVFYGLIVNLVLNLIS